jgi:hypothetical protein
MKRAPLLLATGLVLFAGQALACDRAEMREQFEATRTAAFEEADEDGNSALSRDEFDTFREQMEAGRANAHFGLVDADGDDLLTEEELASAFERRRHRRGRPSR